ncbi:MAG: hypothetical protein JWL97_3811 [Gemmatimonadales bacterium]|nr:hypothetical protein [Gemmatimonadales bacterium]
MGFRLVALSASQILSGIMSGTYTLSGVMRSPNYVPGATGWQILGDGSSEFNNMTVRGNLVVATSGQGVFIYSGAPAAGNLIIAITNQAGSDPFGNAYRQGVSVLRQSTNQYVVLGPSGSLAPGLIINPDSTRFVDGIMFPTTSAPGGGIPFIGINSPYVSGPNDFSSLSLRGGSVDGTVKSAVQLSAGLLTFNGNPVYTATPWTALSFNANFQSAAALANGQAPSYRFVTPTRVELRGQWQPSPAGNIATGAIPITLPAAASPNGGSSYFATGTSSTATTVTGRTRVNTTGDIQFNFTGATAPTWASLDGISYDLS